MSVSAVMNTYKDIEYSLKKSERKTTSIYIERDGSVSVLAPQPFDLARVEANLEKKRRWIYRQLAEWEDMNRTQVRREYVNSESFLYLGRGYQLHIVDKQRVPLQLKNGKFCLSKQSLDQAAKHFRDFYKAKLCLKLNERIDFYASSMGLKPAGSKVLELQNRWGSCTPGGVINIHWKCAMLPLPVLDYVIVHELAHLNNPNHTPAFWRNIEKVMVGYEEQKLWLRFNGAGMSL